MRKHWPKLVAILLVSSVGPVSAERLSVRVDHGGECPYEQARIAAAARSAASDPGISGGAWIGFGHASVFAP